MSRPSLSFSSMSSSRSSFPLQETIELIKYIQNNKLKCSISLALVCCILYNNPLRKKNSPVSAFEVNQLLQNDPNHCLESVSNVTVADENDGQDPVITTSDNVVMPAQHFVYALEHLPERDLCPSCMQAALQTLIQNEASPLAKVALQDCQQILANENTIITRGKVAKRLRRMGIDTTITCGHAPAMKPRNLLIPQSATQWPIQWTNQLWQDWMPK